MADNGRSVHRTHGELQGLLSGSPIIASLVRMSGAVPALALAFPFILWPLTEGASFVQESDFVVAPPSSEGGLLNRIVFPILFAWAMLGFLALPRERLGILLRGAVPIVAVVLSWQAATAIWALEPELVIRRILLQTMIVLCLLLSILAARRPIDVLLPMLAVSALAVLINFHSILTTPPGPIGHQGIYPQKNYLGAVMGVSIVIGFSFLFGNRMALKWASLAMIALALVVLVASRSKTSLGFAFLAPAIGGMLYLAARTLRISPALSMPLLVFSGYGIYQLGAQSFLWDFDSFATATLGDPTLTGRTLIWQFTVSMIERKPLFGWGYDAFWNYSYDAPSVREGPSYVAQMPHAHNGYLDTWLQTGLVGFVMLVVLILATLASSHGLARRSPSVALFVLPAIVFAVGYNMLESGWFNGWNMVSMQFMIALGLAARFGRAQS